MVSKYSKFWPKYLFVQPFWLRLNSKEWQHRWKQQILEQLLRRKKCVALESRNAYKGLIFWQKRTKSGAQTIVKRTKLKKNRPEQDSGSVAQTPNTSKKTIIKVAIITTNWFLSLTFRLYSKYCRLLFIWTVNPFSDLNALNHLLSLLVSITSFSNIFGSD
jgi:hypothetical protein